MVQRRQWKRLVEQGWRQRSVVWLVGVRRVGKTCLCQTLANTEYFDCELPRMRRMMESPEDFLDGLRGRRIVLDEIHRLRNPSEILKIAADHYSDVRVLATGSSTLGASSRFRDTLAGRKRDIWFTPMTLADLRDFGRTDLAHRFLRGGLPPFFLADEPPEREFQEWFDAYWAKDIQELFRLERKSSFQQFAELLMAQSGSIFDGNRFARACGVSHTTISNYLQVLETTFVAHVIRPFSTRRPSEIIAAPKVYAFDTGFVCCHRGWHSLRAEDMGILWEHLVLNEILASSQGRNVLYWRDKRGHEVDFVIRRPGLPPLAIECKWSADDFDARNLRAFRARYPDDGNLVISADVERPFRRTFGDLSVRFAGLAAVAAQMRRHR